MDIWWISGVMVKLWGGFVMCELNRDLRGSSGGKNGKKEEVVMIGFVIMLRAVGDGMYLKIGGDLFRVPGRVGGEERLAKVVMVLWVLAEEKV